MKTKISKFLSNYKGLISPLTTIAIGLFVGGLIMFVTGYKPIEGILGLIRGGFLTKYAIAATLTRATPVIFAGLSAAIAWGSGYSSMGIPNLQKLLLLYAQNQYAPAARR